MPVDVCPVLKDVSTNSSLCFDSRLAIVKFAKDTSFVGIQLGRFFNGLAIHTTWLSAQHPASTETRVEKYLRRKT